MKRRVLSVMAACMLFACGGHGETRETYMGPCEGDADCADELECRERFDWGGDAKVCTMRCDIDEDCPEIWTDHCGDLAYCADDNVCRAHPCF